jgi:hypothetical protein
VGGLKGERAVEVLGENRKIVSMDGLFEDGFKEWDVHLYRISQ